MTAGTKRASVKNFLPPLTLAAVTAGYLVIAYGYEPGARLMPVAVAWIALIFLGLDLLIATGTRAGQLTAKLLNPSIAKEEKLDRARQFSALLWPSLFTLMLFAIGVLPSVPLYVFASMRFHGGWSLRWSAITAGAACVCTWFLFEVLLRTNLYGGALLAPY